MPEGDTVYRAARLLDRAISGQVLLRTDFRVPQLATVDLSGGTVIETISRGKHLLTRIEHDEAWTLHTHLKMEGAWRIYREGQRWKRPNHQARVVLTVASSVVEVRGRPGARASKPPSESQAALTQRNPSPSPVEVRAQRASKPVDPSLVEVRGRASARASKPPPASKAAPTQAVGFSLGIVELIKTADEQEAVGHLGPDLLGPDWNEQEAVRRLTETPERPIGEALLDQRNLAGIGNMYQAELCFLMGIAPQRPVGDVPDLTRLVRRAHQLLDINKDRATQATTGNLREPLWIYNRAGQPCRRCRTPILTEQLGPRGHERAAFWCPACQTVTGPKA